MAFEKCNIDFKPIFLTLLTNFLFAIFVTFITSLSGVAHAQEAGRVQLDGRQIILFDDNSWQYADEVQDNSATQLADDTDEADCVRLKSKILPVSICLDEEIWHLGNEGGPSEFNFSTKDNAMYLLMITEKAEIPLSAFEKAIIVNAQKAAGLTPIDVIIKERIDALGLEWGRMVYDVNIDDLKIKYENFFTTIKGKGSVQFVFYTTPANYDEMSAEIEKVTKRIAIE